MADGYSFLSACVSGSRYPIQFGGETDCRSLVTIEAALQKLPEPLLQILLPSGIMVDGETAFDFDRTIHLKESLLASNAPLDKKFAAVWYPLGHRFAAFLKAHGQNVDELVFAADFVRYLKEKSVNNELHQAYLQAVFQADHLDETVLVSLFEKLKTTYDTLHGSPHTLKDHYVSYQPLGRFREMATQFTEQGLHWDLPQHFAADLSMVHAKQQEDPRSSHQVWMRVYSEQVNDPINHALRAVLGDRVGGRLFMGWFWTYLQDPKADARMSLPVVVGADLDVRMGNFYLGCSGHGGLPLDLGTNPVLAASVGQSPYWEMSLRAYRSDPDFFIGLGASPDLADPSTRFYGAQAVLKL